MGIENEVGKSYVRVSAGQCLIGALGDNRRYLKGFTNNMYTYNAHDVKIGR